MSEEEMGDIVRAMAASLASIADTLAVLVELAVQEIDDERRT